MIITANNQIRCNNCNKLTATYTDYIFCHYCRYDLYFYKYKIYSFSSFNNPIVRSHSHLPNKSPYSEIFHNNSQVDYHDFIVPIIKDNTVMFKEFLTKIKSIILLSWYVITVTKKWTNHSIGRIIPITNAIASTSKLTIIS